MRFDEECECHFIEYEYGKPRLEVVFSESWQKLWLMPDKLAWGQSAKFEAAS